MDLLIFFIIGSVSLLSIIRECIRNKNVIENRYTRNYGIFIATYLSLAISYYFCASDIKHAIFFGYETPIIQHALEFLERNMHGDISSWTERRKARVYHGYKNKSLRGKGEWRKRSETIYHIYIITIQVCVLVHSRFLTKLLFPTHTHTHMHTLVLHAFLKIVKRVG